MNWIQRLITRIVPGRIARAMEVESRAWFLRCACGRDTSVWDMGGIRWIAAGRPYRRAKCAQCGQVIRGNLRKNVRRREE